MRSEIKVLADLMPAEVFMVSRWLSSHHNFMGEEVKELSGMSLMGTLIAFIKALPSCSKHLPRAPPPITFPHEIRFDEIR